jgi:hypothetical protein
MNELEKTTRLALDALKEADRGPSQAFWIGRAIAALEDAIAKQAEPVAWVGLTDAEIYECWPGSLDPLKIARAIEAALKEKNAKQAEPVVEPPKSFRVGYMTGYDDGQRELREKQQAEPVREWPRGCRVCGLGADGRVMGYVCPRSDCPTWGGTV